MKVSVARLSLALMLVCGVSACAKGTMGSEITDGGIDASQADACVPADHEECNDRDDDCDGLIDEDFDTKNSACLEGVGACGAQGIFVCSPDHSGVVCDAIVGMPTEELCDGIDNDCDGMMDEDFNAGHPCDGDDADVCADGVLVCDGLHATKCNDGPDMSPELCDTFDNDCDGKFDEGFDLGLACDGADTDSCKEGVIVCNGPMATKCNDNTTSTVERCNGLDDDCANGPDDTFNVGQSCSAGLGACLRNGTFMCTSNGLGTACSATAGSPSPEVCGDGIDQDCNGADAICPTNDRPSGAIDISAGGTYTVDLSTANDDNWNPTTAGNPDLDCGNQGGRDVFYQFTLPAEEVVYYDTFASNFDSITRLYPGACTALGNIIACGDDACGTTRSQGARDLAAGTYCLVVDQFGSAATTGAASLTFLRTGRTGTKLPSTSGTVTGTTVGGPNNFSSTSCEVNTPGPEAYHFWASCPGANTASANTCTSTPFDTIVTMKSNAVGTDIACSDDDCGVHSKIVGKSITGAGIQWIVIDGFGGASGAYSLAYTVSN
ncbi:MAG TPA: MopE-related protein [Kofleriaceae bacterium]